MGTKILVAVKYSDASDFSKPVHLTSLFSGLKITKVCIKWSAIQSLIQWQDKDITFMLNWSLDSNLTSGM